MNGCSTAIHTPITDDVQSGDFGMMSSQMLILTVVKRKL